MHDRDTAFWNMSIKHLHAVIAIITAISTTVSIRDITWTVHHAAQIQIIAVTHAAMIVDLIVLGIVSIVCVVSVHCFWLNDALVAIAVVIVGAGIIFMVLSIGILI